MNHECAIVCDLIPLYVENLTSAETSCFVKNHIESCSGCRQALESFSQPELRMPRTPLHGLRGAVRRKNIRLISLTVLLAAVVALSLFAFVTAPSYFAYDAGTVSVSQLEDGSVEVFFDEKVAHYQVKKIENTYDDEVTYYISSWNTLMEDRKAARSDSGFTLSAESLRGKSTFIFYEQHNGEPDVLLYVRNAPVPDSEVITLPRLTLAYYLYIAAAGGAVFLILWLCIRKRPAARKVCARLTAVPVCYILGHLLVKGFKTVTYSLQRDLSLILLAAVLLYTVFLCMHSLLESKRDAEQA